MLQEYTSLATALAIGVLIGIERGWQSRKKLEGQRVAGLRTFSLIGILGALTGLYTQKYGIVVFACIFLALACLIIAGYVLSAQKQNADKGLTTEIAALLTFLLSTLSATGQPLLSAAGAVILVSLLGLKKNLHRWVASLEKEELLASLKLLLLSLVVLPLLPNKEFGTIGHINPFDVGWMVVLIAGVSFIGYIGVKLAGAQKGLSITALFGGLASSTAVAISFSRLAKQHPNIERLLVAGVILSSSIMFPRILLEIAVTNINLLKIVFLPVLLMFLVCAIVVIYIWISSKDDKNQTEQPHLKNPFEITSAIKFGLILMVIMYLSQVVQTTIGEKGIYILSVLSGVVDVDAITLSLSKMSADKINNFMAAIGISIAAITNTLFKFSFFIVVAKSKSSKILAFSFLLIALSGALGLYLSKLYLI